MKTETAYRACEEITRREAKNFGYGIRLLRPPERQALSSVYALARRIDDIGDGTAPPAQKLVELAQVRDSLHPIPPDTEDPVLVAVAAATRQRLEVESFARAALFTNQIPAFEAAPSVYAERAYLQTFARATANARKYVLLTTNTHDVIVFDLQDSLAQSLLNLSLPAPKTK